MLHKTPGIVLNYIKYRESSIIVKIFTEQFGTVPYLINGVRSQKSKGKVGLYQPLTLLDLVVYYKEKNEIQRISDARISYPFSSVPFHLIKSTMAMFLTEFLIKILPQGYQNASLFSFLKSSLIQFDQSTSNFQNFHLQLPLKLSYYLGFGPENGVQVLEDTGNYWGRSGELYEAFQHMITTDLFQPLSLSQQSRREMLNHLIAYYEVHIEKLGEFKSLEVLQNLINN